MPPTTRLLMSAALLALLTLSATVGRADDAPAATVETPEAPATAGEATAPEPVTEEAIAAAIERGVDFLVESQNANGSWGSPTRTKGLNIYAPIPGAHHAFRAAVTSLCVAALCDIDSDRADARSALERGENWLIENLPTVRRATPDAIYNVWAHGYSIQALVRMAQRTEDADRREIIRDLVEQQFDRLARYESVDGGWGYYDFDVGSKQPGGSSISFVNAAILIALYEAREAGFEPPERLVQRAIDATQRQRLPDFSYLYGEYLKWQPRRGINRPGGSLGRSQACNAALRLWGDEKITDEVIAVWLQKLLDRGGWLDIGRKRPIPHEAWFQVAGYFFYFGYYYAGYEIEILPADDRTPYQQGLARVMLDRQENDGSWWDFPFYDYHQPYGTAFALMTLVRCQR
ncbi:hypothetical protein Mal4_55230 [Maioricimonas rarisocia]|uniref:Squalene cyclase C-terminal domain-containing protein n=1 Tax=Maioricimonas rarisocia TaxID=2528026 RepID=A0A517ZF95_9PLAN|nr:prenyltransferase/squalene oxidase repeat-containing protein [Maioricimonas rarisocia]QDU41158.1 hypothetical protein Mal4_55230 [Maioricimonas rarisocia]